MFVLLAVVLSGRGSHAERCTRAAQSASLGRGLPGGRVVNLPPLIGGAEVFWTGAGVGIGTLVGVATIDGCAVTVDCERGVLVIPGRKAFLEVVEVVSVFVAGDPPQLQRRAISASKKRRRPFLYLFIINYLLQKDRLKNK
jgi:hypothetical protein